MNQLHSRLCLMFTGWIGNIGFHILLVPKQFLPPSSSPLARHSCPLIHLWGLLRYTMSSTGSPARLRYTIQYIRWKVMNMMGKMTRLYLSMSLALIPNSRVGGWGGSAGVDRGRSGARVLSSLHTCPARVSSVLSRGNVSTPSLTVHVSIQHVWNRTQAWNTQNGLSNVFSLLLILLVNITEINRMG